MICLNITAEVCYLKTAVAMLHRQKLLPLESGTVGVIFYKLHMFFFTCDQPVF